MTSHDLVIRIAEVPCGAGSAFLHPACCGSDITGVEYHDRTITELLEQQVIYCDGCGERIVPKGVEIARREESIEYPGHSEEPNEPDPHAHDKNMCRYEDHGRYQSGYRVYRDGSYREDFGGDR